MQLRTWLNAKLICMQHYVGTCVALEPVFQRVSDMGPKIVAVDDDPISLELLKEMLTDSGHDVDTACNGQNAMDFL